MNPAPQVPERVRLAILEACEAFECHPADLLGASHEPQFVAGRRLIAYRLRTAGWSLSRIGRVLGRHHTTVLNLLRAGRRGS